MAIIRLIKVGCMARQSGHIDVVEVHLQSLHPKPGQLAEGQVGLGVVQHGFGHISQVEQVLGAEDLLGHSAQKFLLHLDTADVSFCIAALDARVVLAEAHQLNGLFAVQMLHSRLQIDMEILGRIVPHHIGRHIEIHAADEIDQLFKTFKADHHIPVDGNAQQHLQLFFQLFRTAVEAAVDLFDLPLHIGHGIPGDVHHVHLLGLYIIGSHNDGIGTGAAIVGAAEHEGIIIVLPFPVSVFNERFHQVGIGVFLPFAQGDLRLLHRYIGGLGKGLEEGIDSHAQHQQHPQNDQRDIPGFQALLFLFSALELALLPLARFSRIFLWLIRLCCRLFAFALALGCALRLLLRNRRAGKGLFSLSHIVPGRGAGFLFLCVHLGKRSRLVMDGRRLSAVISAKYLHFPFSFFDRRSSNASCERRSGSLPFWRTCSMVSLSACIMA